jgi:hypothetical protein
MPRHPCTGLVSRLAELPIGPLAWEVVVVDAIRAAPSLVAADAALGVPRGTTQRWARWLREHGHELPAHRPGWAPGRPLPPRATPEEQRRRSALGVAARRAAR